MTSKRNTSTIIPLSITALVVLLAVLAHVNNIHHDTPSAPLVVPVLDHLPSIDQLRAQHMTTPFVFKLHNTQANQWNAVDEWSWRQIGFWPIEWQTGMVSNEPMFKHYRDRRLSSYLTRSGTWTPPFTKGPLPSGALYRGCSKQKYHYVAGALTGKLVEDLQPHDQFLVPDVDGKLPSERPNPGFFFSCKGVQVSAHYDEGHNYFFQLDGNKTMVLFPPKLVPALYTAPTMHPHYRQSAIHDVRGNVDLEQFPDFARAVGKGYTVTLQPGDGLFLPAWWIHAVECDTHSSSVNIMTDASPHELLASGRNLMRDVLGLKLPLYSPAVTDTHVDYLLCSLMDKQARDNSVANVAHYIETRWRHVLPRTGTVVQGATYGCCDIDAILHVVGQEDAVIGMYDAISDSISTWMNDVRGEYKQLTMYRIVDELLDKTFSTKTSSDDDLIHYLLRQQATCPF